MAGKQMEGDSRRRRKQAREGREAGRRPSQAGVTTGGSQQRRHLERDEDHEEKVEAIRRGKQDVIAQNTPEVRPRSRRGNVHRS
jgi:hypothetical protein